MRNNKVKLLLLVPILLSTTSCTKSRNAIQVVENYDLKLDASDSFSDYVITVNAKELRTMLDDGMSFILFFGSRYCSHCDDVEDYLMQYLPDNFHTIYYYDLGSEVDITYSDYLTYLNTYDSTYFPGLSDVYTPRMLIVSDGQVIDEVNSSKLTGEYSVFKSAMNSFIYGMNVYTLTKLDAFNLYREDFNDSSVYYYDSAVEGSAEEYVEVVYHGDYRYPVLVLDYYYLESDLLEYIETVYGPELNTLYDLN